MVDVNILPPPPPDRRSNPSKNPSQDPPPKSSTQTEQHPQSENKILQVLRRNIVDLRDSLSDFKILKSEKNREFIPDSLNIILFGPTGSGKSSLIK